MKTVQQMFPDCLIHFVINRGYKDWPLMGGYSVFESMIDETVTLHFRGDYEVMVKVREFLKGVAIKTDLVENIDSRGGIIVSAEFMVSAAAIKLNEELYNAMFTQLLEEELSKKPTT